VEQMDSLDTLEIAYVELTGVVLFREEKHVGGGIMAYQVYAVKTDQGIIVIRPGKIRHKRIGMRWLKNRTENLYLSNLLFSRTECIKFLINKIKIEKIYWKHKITEKMMKRIIDAVTRSKEIYDN
jgi:hypothetical protein